MGASSKIALITGAKRGIGFEAARALAARGWRVMLSARQRRDGESAVASLRGSGIGVEFLLMDVADPESIVAAAKEFSKRADRLDALVNNAGILGNTEQTAVTLTLKNLQATLNTNAIGPLLVVQQFLPFLYKGRPGRVINVSSGVGSLSQSSGWAPAYAISKTTLNAITLQLHHALHDKGIPVNAVCPGWVRTAMGGSQAPRSVEQGADTIVWLADEAPASMSGQFLRDRHAIPW